MRWLACCVLLAGCLRARATVVHPTGIERTSGGKGSTIARTAPASETPEQPTEISPNLLSAELGAMIPFKVTSHEGVRVHLAPGLRLFGGDSGSVLFGVAVGADFLRERGPGFALEGSIYAGDSSSDPRVIEQAVDMFAGVTLHSKRTPASVAVGPSLGLLGLPGGHSVVILGIGLRVSGGPRD